MSSDIRTISGARDLLDKGKISARELLQESLDCIHRFDGDIHAFLDVFEEVAIQEADEFDQQRQKTSKAGSLAGISIAVKDIICTRAGKTTAASNMLKSFRSPYDATVITRLKDAGAIINGKTNFDEYAMGSSTEYSAFGPTKNPWDSTRVPGGSSGGSAAAVAYGGSLGALGTDTGGSVRHPASFCGVVGVRPTYGRVSRFGVIAYGSSLDQVGPITRTVEDAAIMMQVLAGEDSRDATSSDQPVPSYTRHIADGIKDLRIGIPREYFSDDIDAEVRHVVREAVKDLEKDGAIIKELSLPLTAAGIPVYYLIVKAEASTNLARYDGLRYAGSNHDVSGLIEQYVQTRGAGFGSEVKRAILMGTYVLSAGYYDAWYKQASRVRTLIRREFEEAFQEVDVIAGPTAPEVAFPFGSKTTDPLKMYLADLFTVPVSVAGIPAISVPCGFSSGRLPIGMQLSAPHFQEDMLFRVARAYEQQHEWWKQMPVQSA